MRWSKLRWERETRYYEAHLHQELFGDWNVTTVWGSIGKPNGQVKHEVVTHYQVGVARLSAITHRRQQRHYTSVY